MLKSLVGFEGTSVSATDGDAGTVARFLVDLDHWVVQHIVLNADSRLGEAGALISPQQIAGGMDDDDLVLSAALEQIRHAATARVGPPPDGLVDSREIVGAHLQAIGGPIGHLDDLLIEEDTWRVRYVVVDPRNWWLGKHVLISPEWIDRFDPAHRTLQINVEREAIKSAPEYDAGYVLTRDDEAAMFRHYQRRPYWSA